MPGGHHPRRTIEHRAEVVALPQLGFAGRQPHPHRQLQRPLRGHRRIDRRLGEANAAHTPSPVCLNNQPPCASIALRNTSSWAASAARIASASASHRRSTRTLNIGEQKRHHPRRGSRRHGIASAHCDMSFEAKRFRHGAVAIPIVAVGGSRRRAPAPAEPAAAAARSRGSPDRRRLARPPIARSRPRLRPRRRRRRAPAASPPEQPVAATPMRELSRSRTASSTAARISGIAPSRSPRLAFSRAAYDVDDRQHRTGRIARCRHMSRTSRQQPPVRAHAPPRRPDAPARCPAPTGRRLSAISSLDRSAICSASSMSRSAASSASSTPYAIAGRRRSAMTMAWTSGRCCGPWRRPGRRSSRHPGRPSAPPGDAAQSPRRPPAATRKRSSPLAGSPSARSMTRL